MKKILFVFLLGVSKIVASPRADQATVNIRNHIFQVEVMRTTEEWEKGLMFRQHLGKREGMLFFGKKERPQSFWMKNTLIPLDIIFISKDLKVVSIQKKAIPQDETPLPSKGPAMHVLEILGGESDAIGIQPNDKVEFSNIDSKK